MTELSLSLDTPNLATTYELVSADRQFAQGKLLVRELAVARGERVLDIGAGTGLLAAHVAELVGPTGFVLGIDPLPLRIELAQRKGRPNLEFRVGDASSLGDLETASFDVVYLNAVFHWLPDKHEPLRQFQRVLRPGGRLGITTGSREHPNTIQKVRADVLSRAPYASFSQQRPSFGHHVSESELRGLLVQAGFEVEASELVPNVFHHPTPEAAIDFSQASSFGNYLGHLPEALQRAARTEIARELERHRTSEGIRQEGVRIVARARRKG